MAGAGCNFNFSVGKPKEPTNDELQKLIKATMADFAESLEMDDFEILRNNASTIRRQTVSAQKIRGTFIAVVEKKEKAIPIFRETQSLEAEIKTQTMAKVGKNYVLKTRGTFPTDTELTFKLEYFREDGKWKLQTIDIKT